MQHHNSDLTANESSRNLTNKMPDAFVILFFIIVIASALTYIVPQGSFVKNVDENGAVSIDRSTFTFSEENEQGVHLFATGDDIGLLNYVFDGLTSGDRYGSAVGVVAFILIVGGAFGIVMHTGAVQRGIQALINFSSHADKVLLPLLFVLFSLGGAVFGMGEEAIAFCIILVPLVIALGFDAITAVLLTYVATQIGFATSWMNPFSVAIAQGIAGVPLFSGQEFRMLLWLVFTAIGLTFTLRYAYAVKRNPTLSKCPQANSSFAESAQQTPTNAHFTKLDMSIIGIFFAGIIWVLWGVLYHQYYIPEIASQFFAIGLVIGIVSVVFGGVKANNISESFQRGASDLLPAALIVGMAKGIIIILGGDAVDSPSTLNTLLYYASGAVSDTGASVNAIFMLIFQTIFNFFVASGSGQAAITMPLMAPLSDLIGVTRQTAVLAFQLGDGFSNIIIPTSASLIGCLGVARIDWTTWFLFIWKLFLVLFSAACLCMFVAVQIGFN